MEQEMEQEVKISRNLMLEVPERPKPELSYEKKLELESWIADTLPGLKNRRQDIIGHAEATWEKTLAGRAYKVPRDSSVSNLSVPLTIWVSSWVRASTREAIWEVEPLLLVDPLPAKVSVDTQEQAKELRRFLEYELRSERGLNAREEGQKFEQETINLGTSALKVAVELPRPKLKVPSLAGGQVEKMVQHGRPKFYYVSFKDLIYWDGYGTDTQKMPYVGNEFCATWSDILADAAVGNYEKEAVEKVRGFFSDRQGLREKVPPSHQEHNLVELYLDYVIDDSGLLAPLVVTYHQGASVLLRVDYNTMPAGVRPIFIGNFDPNPDPTKAAGIGVCEKMESVQEEADEIHNIGVEAGKRAAAHLVGVRYSSRAVEDLGGDDPILPGDRFFTENPSEDVVLLPLGDPRAAEHAVGLEERNRLYVTRMFGLDESAVGNVESGKRVPASLGLSTRREGKVGLGAFYDSVSRVYTNATLLAAELYKTYFPERSLRAVLSPEAVEMFRNTVFVQGGPDLEEVYRVRVSAQDAASTQEVRKQELLILTQFMMGFYDKLVEYGNITMQLPPEIRPVMETVLMKLQNTARLLLNNMESVPNPDEVIPEVAEMLRQLQQMGSVMSEESEGRMEGGI